MMKSSLEIYSPMQQDGVNIPNQAQSLNFMTVKPAQSGVDVVDADGNANSIHVFREWFYEGKCFLWRLCYGQ